MKDLTQVEIKNTNGGIAFFVYFAAGYLGTFAGAAGFAFGAVDAMADRK